MKLFKLAEIVARCQENIGEDTVFAYPGGQTIELHQARFVPDEHPGARHPFRRKHPVKMIILDDQHLGMVAQWKDRFYGSHHCNTALKTRSTDVPAIPISCRSPKVTIFRAGRFSGGRMWRMRSAKSWKPTVCSCWTAIRGYEEHVLPMIPPGRICKDIMTD